jgi:hypothetical protein
LKLSSDSKRNPQPIAWGNSNFECIALPIWGKNYASEDAQPVGWILYNAVGKELIQYRLIDNEWMPSISKTVFGSWFAARHLGRSQAPLIIIDQATLEIRRRDGSPEFLIDSQTYPAMSGAFTNSSGCGQKPFAWLRAVVKGKSAFVLHDSDEPGQVGAARWREAIQTHGRFEVPNRYAFLTH